MASLAMENQVGESSANVGLSIVGFDCKRRVPGLVNIQKAIENGHRNSGIFPMKNGGSFHGKMWLFTRGYDFLLPIRVTLKRAPLVTTPQDFECFLATAVMKLGNEILSF